MKHIVVGTAGHIDHGKTAIIKALSGFEGDTTHEEQKRGITIDLSFSSIQNKDTNIAFIDVPGHEKLLKNMISGAFGFDACLVVIDAKEGIKPQTIEHVEILNLLNVSNIIVALSKVDLVNKDTIPDKKEQIENFFKKLKNIDLKSIVPVSIYDENSIVKLKNELFNLPKIPKITNNLFRYYIDRSFSISGAGSIVTGTVLDGIISVGDKVYVAQYAKELVVKNIQVHEKDVQTAFSSQRAAINLQNPKIVIKKGLLLSKKGYIRGFKTIDVSLQIINNRKLKHNSKVIFFIGTKQIEAKILFYDDKKELTNGFAKLEFEEEIFSIYDEPFMLSINGQVIAGGIVLNPINDPIKKSIKKILLEVLLKRDFNSAFEILTKIHKKGFGLISSNQRFGLNHNEALEISSKLKDIFLDKKELVLYPNDTLILLEKKILSIYEKNQYALLSSKSISLKLKWASIGLIEYILNKLVKDKIIILKQGIYKKSDTNIQDLDDFIEEKIYNLLCESGITPGAPYNIYDDLDIDRYMGDKALKKLTSSKKVIRLSHNLFISYPNLNTLVKELKEIIKKERYLDIKIFKEYYENLSRKYIVAYLEYLDKQNDIINDGLKRKLTR